MMKDRPSCSGRTCPVSLQGQQRPSPAAGAAHEGGQGQKKDIRYIDFHDVIECLIAAVEARDPYTSGHSSRVADITLLLADEMGLRGPEKEIIHMAAHMHDIGKIGIPDGVLSKEGRLDDEDWRIIKRHPLIGYDILSRSDALLDIAKVVLHHHERWDGRGYPDRLKGNEIPIGARMIAVADAIDAMLSERPYRKAMTLSTCAREVEANRGSQFDGDIAAVVLRCMREHAGPFENTAREGSPLQRI